MRFKKGRNVFRCKLEYIQLTHHWEKSSRTQLVNAKKNITFSMDHKSDMTAVYKATASLQQPLSSCTMSRFYCVTRRWHCLNGYNDTAFPEISVKSLIPQANSWLKRIQSEAIKKDQKTRKSNTQGIVEELNMCTSLNDNEEEIWLTSSVKDMECLQISEESYQTDRGIIWVSLRSTDN